MKKTNLTTITKELNNYFEGKNQLDYYDWELSINYNKKQNLIEFNAISLLDYDDVNITIENANELTTYTLLKNIISEIYDQEINYRNRIIKGYNAFLRRKATSLSLWNSRDNDIKVAAIVTEISKKSAEVDKMKNEVSIYKEIVRILFDAIDKFAKEEKLADKKAKVEKRIEQLQRVKNDDNCIFVG